SQEFAPATVGINARLPTGVGLVGPALERHTQRLKRIEDAATDSPDPSARTGLNDTAPVASPPGLVERAHRFRPRPVATRRVDGVQRGVEQPNAALAQPNQRLDLPA